MSAEVEKVELGGSHLHAGVRENGEIFVILKPTVESMGLNWSAQLHKLKTRSWASISETNIQAPDQGQHRMWTVCDLDTWSMLLANINENEIKNDAARELVIKYQLESAKVLRDYWTRTDKKLGSGDLMTVEIAEAYIKETKERMRLGIAHSLWTGYDNPELQAAVSVADYLVSRGKPNHPTAVRKFNQEVLEPLGWVEYVLTPHNRSVWTVKQDECAVGNVVGRPVDTRNNPYYQVMLTEQGVRKLDELTE